MKEIIFVTTNSGKVETLRNKLPSNIFIVTQKNIPLPELQADTIKFISEEKAKAAFAIIKKPLIVQDSAFHINALKGFPGVYVKYIQETIGIAGLLKLMDGMIDKTCYFEQAVTYIDNNITKTFISDKKFGTISNANDNIISSYAWGDIWKIFVPKGFSKTLASLSQNELKTVSSKEGIKSEFTYFTEWFINKEK